MMPLMTVAASRDETTAFAADLRVQNGCAGGVGCAGAGTGAGADAPGAVGSIFAGADEVPVGRAREQRTPYCDTRGGETRGDKD